MAHSQLHGTRPAEGIRVACGKAAHLAGVAIAFEHPRACLLGDVTLEDRKPLRGFEEVLPGLQVGAIFVGEDLISVKVAKFASPPTPFRCAAALTLQGLLGIHCK
jgi:hypothetical protein